MVLFRYAPLETICWSSITCRKIYPMDLRRESSCARCRFKSKAAAVLSEEELHMLAKACVEVSVNRGDAFFRQGTPSGHVVYLKEGLARIHKQGPRNRDQILKISCSGTYLGIQTILGDVVNQYSASALTQAVACYIRVGEFRLLIQKNGDFANELIDYICREELSHFNRLVSHWQKQLIGRLAETLLYFAEEIFRAQEYPMLLTRQELASMVGGTRESVSRAMKEFVDSGIIGMNKKEIRILKPELIKKLADSG